MGLLSELIITGARGGVPSVISSAGRSVLPAVISNAAAGTIPSALSSGGGAPQARSNGTPSVSELQIQGAAPASANALNMALAAAPAAAGAGGAAVADYAGGGDDGGAATEVSPLTISAPKADIGKVIEAIPAIGLPQAMPKPGEFDLSDKMPQLEGQGEDGLGMGEAAGAAGILGLLGLDPKTLLGAGILGAGLLAGGDGKDSAGEGGLKEQINGNQNLINMLAGKVSAGQAGQIGGAGMNTLARQVRRAQAAIRQRYASMGMSGSSAEQSDLNSAAEAGVDMQFKIGQTLAQQGLAAIAALTGQNMNAYAALMSAATAKDTQIGNALANFAGALVK